MQVADAQLIALKDKALEALGVDAETRAQLSLADTPDNQPGDRGFPVFVLARVLRQAPPVIAGRIVEEMQRLLDAGELEAPMVAELHAAGPYVNFTLATGQLATAALQAALAKGESYGAGSAADPERWMIEFSAPNTNKPQHLGHVRNNLLGQSVVELLKFAGHDVIPVNLINDRGIHICKSMLMYKLHGNGATPESTGVKGDHLVGRYYVMFDQRFRQEYASWQETPDANLYFEQWLHDPGSSQARDKLEDQSRAALSRAFFSGYSDTYFNHHSDLGAQTKQMLVDWEAGDPDVRALWETMNAWVFAGFDTTYATLGISFDQVYYESNTYSLGRNLVEQGLNDGLFVRVEGGAVACDLSDHGFPGEQKILLRSDGTTVYMTQDLGTALERFDEHDMDRMVYVVGNEQDHHFRVLFTILGLIRPGLQNQKGDEKLIHKSYGMISLPEGRMKTRTGTVVDADDLVEGMIEYSRAKLLQNGVISGYRSQGLSDGEATEKAEETHPIEAIAMQAAAGGWDALLQKHLDLAPEDFHERARVIGLAALKYFILKYNPKTNFMYDPESSIRPTGDSGVYALYTYARIQSIRREVGAGSWPEATDAALAALSTEREMDVVAKIAEWPDAAAVAGQKQDPSRVTTYVLELCSAFNAMYNDKDHRISGMPEGARRTGLLTLCQATGVALKTALGLLGIETLDAM